MAPLGTAALSRASVETEKSLALSGKPPSRPRMTTKSSSGTSSAAAAWSRGPGVRWGGRVTHQAWAAARARPKSGPRTSRCSAQSEAKTAPVSSSNRPKTMASMGTW